jgi:hypothetical protein
MCLGVVNTPVPWVQCWVSMGARGAAKVTVWKPNLCNAPSGALGSPTWTREVTQGNSEGSGVQGGYVEHRGLLCDWDNTRSSLHPSVVTLGCLDGGDERGEGQGCYSSQLGQRPGTDTTSRVEFQRGTRSQLTRWQRHTLSKEQGTVGVKTTAWIGGSSQA